MSGKVKENSELVKKLVELKNKFEKYLLQLERNSNGLALSYKDPLLVELDAVKLIIDLLNDDTSFKDTVTKAQVLVKVYDKLKHLFADGPIISDLNSTIANIKSAIKIDDAVALASDFPTQPLEYRTDHAFVDRSQNPLRLHRSHSCSEFTTYSKPASTKPASTKPVSSIASEELDSLIKNLIEEIDAYTKYIKDKCQVNENGIDMWNGRKKFLSDLKKTLNADVAASEKLVNFKTFFDDNKVEITRNPDPHTSPFLREVAYFIASCLTLGFFNIARMGYRAATGSEYVSFSQTFSGEKFANRIEEKQKPTPSR